MNRESSEERAGAWEHARRKVSWAAGVVFVTSFLALLALSATRWWTPDNPWLTVFDVVWKVSGLVLLASSVVPWLARSVRQLGSTAARD